MVEGDLRPVMTRAGTMIVQQWKQAGSMPRSMWRRARCRRDGPPAISTPSSAGASRPGEVTRICPTSWTAGIRSSSPSPANRSRARNWQRWSSPALDKIIEETRTVGFDDPKSIELGKDYVKLAVQEMPTIPLMAYNVFTAMDQTYWTGFPTSENPYTDPVPNWGNSRSMFVKLKPAN